MAPRPESTLHPVHAWPRPLAFALSGGGAFGSVQLGMIQALADQGIRPDLVVGTSVGSLNGALLAHDPVRAPELLGEIWATMSRSALFGHGWLRALGNLARHRTLSRLGGLDALIERSLPANDFTELALPFAAVATDAATGEPELFRAGSLRAALLASSAVPGIFPSVEIDGRHYVDGGVSANLPIRQAIAFGARSVIALDASPAPAPSAPRGLAPTAFHMATLMVRNQRAHAIDDLLNRYPILVMPTVTPHDIGSFNFGLTDELIAESLRRSTELLASMHSQTRV